MSLWKHCGDCSNEADCDWCEVCSSFVCDDCDISHDCLAEDLGDFEEVLLDQVDPDSDTAH